MGNYDFGKAFAVGAILLGAATLVIGIGVGVLVTFLFF